MMPGRNRILYWTAKISRKIISNLKDTYSVTIKLGDQQLANKTLTGKLRTEVADDCIDNLAIILDAEVKKEGDSYVVSKRFPKRGSTFFSFMAGILQYPSMPEAN